MNYLLFVHASRGYSDSYSGSVGISLFLYPDILTEDQINKISTTDHWLIVDKGYESEPGYEDDVYIYKDYMVEFNSPYKYNIIRVVKCTS